MSAYLDGRHHPRDALPERIAFLAEVGGAPAGYIGGHLSRRFDCEGEVQYLYVAPAYRRARVATALLRELAGWFVTSGARRICVNVDGESAGAEPFYIGHGAVPLEPHWCVWPDIGLLLADGRRS